MLNRARAAEYDEVYDHPEAPTTFADRVLPFVRGEVLELLAYTGVRIGEAFALRRRDVNLLHSQLIISRSLSYLGGHTIFDDTKNHHARTITIPAGLARDLKRHLAKIVASDPETLVFSAPRGGPLNYTNFMRRFWDPAIEAAKLPRFTPHNLRDSHASWLVDDGWSVLDVAQRLGHESATVTTKHYARAIVGRDQELAKSLDSIRGRLGAAKSARRYQNPCRSENLILCIGRPALRARTADRHYPAPPETTRASPG